MGTFDGTFDATFDRTSNGTFDETFDGTFDGTSNRTFDRTCDGTFDGPFDGMEHHPQTTGCAEANSERLERARAIGQWRKSFDDGVPGTFV